MTDYISEEIAHRLSAMGNGYVFGGL